MSTEFRLEMKVLAIEACWISSFIFRKYVNIFKLIMPFRPVIAAERGYHRRIRLLISRNFHIVTKITVMSF
jgi:hypothetical protein